MTKDYFGEEVAARYDDSTADMEGEPEHGFTAVVRGHRGRGIATALKGTQLAWAAEQG